MNTMVEHLKKAAKNALKERFKKDYPVEWQYTDASDRGDVSTHAALPISKDVALPPREVAQVIQKALQGINGVQCVEVAGPGYVNVWLTPDELLKGLIQTRTACTTKVKRKKEAPIIVEYSQPNIAKPLGAHHLLTTLIGQTIANLYRHHGFNVICWNYMGDWGTQFGKLAVAVDRWGDSRPASEYSVDEFLELYVRFHRESENDPTLEVQARERFKLLEAGDKRIRSFWEAVVATTKDELKEIYERMHVSFDTDKSESFYEDKMAAILKEGIEKNVFVKGEEGALIVEFDSTQKLPPYLVQKSDGATLYSTRDIAQMRHRIDAYHPQSIFIVTDIAQKLHFEQLVATCKKLNWDLPPFENTLSGRMRFRDASMSTRKGSVIKLKEVLDEAVERAHVIIEEHRDTIKTGDRSALAEMIGMGAVAYGILSQNRKQDIVFDWKTFLSFEGNSAPYLQYTHARSRSVLRKAQQKTFDRFPLVSHLSSSERKLIGTLLQFSNVLEEARRMHMPHKLAHYLYTLCQDYNAFYNTEPILQAPEPSRTLRLNLTACAADVLKTGAEILTLRVPDRM